MQHNFDPVKFVSDPQNQNRRLMAVHWQFARLPSQEAAGMRQIQNAGFLNEHLSIHTLDMAFAN